MTDYRKDQEILNYELPADVTQDNIDALLADPATRWFAAKRLFETKLGLTAAGEWNELLHPRGPDGKFIQKFGWVRFLFDGRWVRGYVEDIKEDGTVVVTNLKGTDGSKASSKIEFTSFEARKKLYSLPKPKAHLPLPDIDKPADGAWEKTGGQGGSNPGGKFKLVDAAGVRKTFARRAWTDTLVPDNDLEVLALNYDSSSNLATALSMQAVDDLQKANPNSTKNPVENGMQKKGTNFGYNGFFVFSVDSGDRIVQMTTVKGREPETQFVDVSTGKTYDTLSKALLGDGPYAIIGGEAKLGYFIPVKDAGRALDPLDSADKVVIDYISRTGLELSVGSIGDAPHGGVELYVKRSKSPQHARNEILANRLYELAGIPIPQTYYSNSDEVTIGSQIATGEVKSLGSSLDDEAVMSQIRSGMVVDAWLANWDVAGMSYDNIIVVDGVPRRIDAGGALLYRAQGSPKGNKFGGKVIELESLRNASLNPQAAKVFGSTTPEELQHGAELVAAIHPDVIKQYVEKNGLPESLANTLIARRAYIIDELLGGVDPHAPKKKDTPAKSSLADLSDSELLTGYEALKKNDGYGNTFGGADKAAAALAEYEKEISDRKLIEKKAEIDTRIEQLKSEGINPKFEEVHPEEPANGSAPAITSNDVATTVRQWLWDPKREVWYASNAPFEPEANSKTALLEQAHETDRAIADVLAKMPPFNGDPGKAPITSVDDVISADGVFNEKYRGRMIWLGGHVFEVVGPKDSVAQHGVKMTSASIKTSPGVELREVGSGKTFVMPRPESINLSGYYIGDDPDQQSRAKALFTNFYVLDVPEEDRDGLKLLLEKRHVQELNAILSDPGRANVGVPLYDVNERPEKATLTYGDGTVVNGVHTAIIVNGFRFVAPPNAFEGAVNIESKSYYKTQKLDISSAALLAPSDSFSGSKEFLSDVPRYYGSIVEGDTAAKAIENLPTGTIFLHAPNDGGSTYYRSMFIKREDGKVQRLSKEDAALLNAPTSVSDSSFKGGTKFNIVDAATGVDIYDPKSLKDRDEGYVVVTLSQQTVEAMNARKSKERILSQAQADLSKAILQATPVADTSIGDVSDTIGAEETPDIVKLLQQQETLTARVRVANNVYAGEESFNYEKSPLDFIGAVTFTKPALPLDKTAAPGSSGPKFDDSKPPTVAVGMWVLLAPGTASDRLADNAQFNWSNERNTLSNLHYNAPARIENIEYDEDGNVKRLTVKFLDGSVSKFDPPKGKDPLSPYVAPRIAPPNTGISSPTLKSDGTIVIDGTKVGTWHSYSGERNITIDAEFSPTGIEYKVRVTEKPVIQNAKQVVSKVVVFESSHAGIAAAKSAKAKKAAKSIKWKGGKLGDGSQIISGTPVRSNVTGIEGTLVGTVHPSVTDMVYVKFGDKMEVIDPATLSALSVPDAPTKVAAPKSTVVIPKDLPKPVLDAIAAAPDKFVMQDGNTPVVGMKVDAGKGTKVVSGTIVAINKDGYMRVQTTEGDAVWRSIKVATATGGPSHADEPAIGMQLATQAPPTMPTIDNPTAQPATELVPTFQSADRIQSYTETGGITTIDGYIPDIGMPVIDRQGNRLIIAGKPGNKEAVLVYDSTDPGTLKSRRIDGLTVDYASFYGKYGKINDLHGVSSSAATQLDVIESLKGKVGSANLEGASVYMVAEKHYGGSDARSSSYLVIICNNGRVYKMKSSYSGVQLYAMNIKKGSKDFFTGQYAGDSIEKLGVISLDQTAPTSNSVAFQFAGSDSSATLAHYTDDPWSNDPQVVLNMIAATKAASAPKIISDKGKVIKPVTATSAPSTSFAPPPTTKKKKPVDMSKLPTVTGAGADFDTVPSYLASEDTLSPKQAADFVVENKDSTAPDSSVRYAMMDEDIIEDALIRYQVVEDADGTQFVEMRFRLQEKYSEKLADELLASNATTYGAWVQSNTVYPTDLVEGDYISVRLSASTTTLKPREEGTVANAKVVGSPVLIGKSSTTGYDVYRVKVEMSDGEKSVVDIEMREAATVALMEYDPDKPVVTTGGTLSITEAAKTAGWTQTASTIGGVIPVKDSTEYYTSPTGTLKIPAGQDTNPAGVTSKGGIMHLTQPDGVDIRFNAVPTSAGGTAQGESRRNELARDVRIRVPLDHPDRDTAFSRSLEALGVPVEKQVQPPPEALSRMILNKAFSHYSPTFVHRKGAPDMNNPLDPNDPGVKATLDMISKRIGIEVTLDDFEFRVSHDGRLVPMMSKRVGEAVTKKQGNTYYRHSGFSVARAVELFGSTTTTGIMGADERYSVGIGASGSSTTADTRDGAGDRVYITGSSSNHLGGNVVMSATTINRTINAYVNKGDGWGRRKADNNFITMKDAHEYMIKRKIDAAEIAYVRLSKEDRDNAIAELKKRGVTEVDGRPIEEIIVAEFDVSPTDSKFQDLGAEAFELVSTLGTLASNASGAGETAGAPAV